MLNFFYRFVSSQTEINKLNIIFDFYKTQVFNRTQKNLFQLRKEAFKLLWEKGSNPPAGGQLAVVQSSVVGPGRLIINDETALCYVYPVILTLETKGLLP